MAVRSTYIVGIILAAGKGTRINSKIINKVAYLFLEKPMILYGVELLENLVDKTIVVIGAFSHSVKAALKGKRVQYALQKHRLGTGHAVKVALQVLNNKAKPSLILVGMGDHMMFYKKEAITKLIRTHLENKAAVSFITTRYHKPDILAWGRVERDKSGKVLDIVEQKDATLKQRKIKELNSGFYCFDFNFLKTHIDSIKKSKITKEYYLTDIIQRAFKDDLKVIGMPVRFREIGIGVNKLLELEQSQKLFSRFKMGAGYGIRTRVFSLEGRH